MCMSVKKIEDRIKASNNKALWAKLNYITQNERIDNCSLVMATDSYEFKAIYALGKMVHRAVLVWEAVSQFKQNSRLKLATV